MGSHTLGPHVVGQRVVVRHLLPDGRASDVLGTCTSWGADSLTIDRDGPPGRAGPIEIALSDVVTGKPVPPRASVRARVPAREVELHSFADWPEVARAHSAARDFALAHGCRATAWRKRRFMSLAAGLAMG